MTSLLNKLLGRDKLWSIGDHRVKSVRVIVRGTAPLGVSDHVAGRRKQRYECVDCEKRFDSREEFENEQCYEVIR